MTLAERLRSPDAGVRLAAIAALEDGAPADAAALAALVDCLGHARKAVQRPAAEAFARLAARGVAVRDVLLGSLSAAAPRQRWGAAFALARLGPLPDEAVPVLLETLGGDDGDLRWAAAGLVAGLRERVGLVEALCDLARTGAPTARRMAVYCLRDLEARTPRAEAAVAAAIDDDDRQVRLAGITSLARLAGDRGAAARRLVAALATGEPQVRRAAAAALAVLGERSADVLTALRQAEGDADLSLGRAAARALRSLAAG